MSVFQLGPIIRNRREELGFSQEDLADGICSVPTLSRIENGERMPTKNHFEMLMQRLGYSAMSLDYFTDKEDFLIHELKFKIREAYVAKDYASARAKLDALKKITTNPSSIDKQFVLLYGTLLSQNQYDVLQKIEQFETAVLLTQPKYNIMTFRVLSYEEIILLNNIALCYAKTDNVNRAISIWYAIKEYYGQHMISSEEALRTQPMILYNLSKYLGRQQRYDECIEICNVGIRIARTSGRCTQLGKMLFNHGWALINRNRIGDCEMAKQYIIQAYQFEMIMGNESVAEAIQSYYKSIYSSMILV